MSRPEKSRKKVSPDERKLIRRYLIWCYKTTKEELDRIDRYFTQVKVDEWVFNALIKHKAGNAMLMDPAYDKELVNFQEYIKNKKARVFPLKYSDQQGRALQPHYSYLKNRLMFLEQAIVSFLGKRELTVIREMYEEQMARNILESKENTR